MLLSMTGFGDARHQDDRQVISLEVRTVNNRYLKVNIKCSDQYATMESDIERIVRESISRGTVSVSVKIQNLQRSEDFRLNAAALGNYAQQATALSRELNLVPPTLGELLGLPGVVADDGRPAAEPQSVWPIVEQVLKQCLQRLQVFRAEEGRSMDREMVGLLGVLSSRLQEVVVLAPRVVSEYRTKVLERVRTLIADEKVTVSETDLIREVAVHADRADITEEITRLKCHIEQFTAFVNEPVSAGRKLDFLTQEMFREVNTIGSKANHVGIAHHVVEMKAAVEKIREILQNVE